MPEAAIPKLRLLALAAAMLVPLGLLHAFVLAEIGIAVTDVLFLAVSVRSRQTAWLREPWLIAAMLWWLWLVICSTPLPALGLVTAGWRLAFLQALLIVRFILFVAALENWVLASIAARRLAWAVLALCVLWIGVEAWQQYLTGRNIFGNPRWGDGSLTGPFWKPRAGQLYAHLLFVALLPVVVPLLDRRSAARASGVALLLLGVLTSVLIGQRMGSLLCGLSLLIAAFFIPRLRQIAALALALALLFLFLTPVLSPPTWHKLIGESAENFHHFAQSPYGELFTRATVMGLRSPWHGWGYNGFRAFCPLPLFNGGLPAIGVAPSSLSLYACGLHPQNYYIQAFSDAGLPGLLLFIATLVIWLRRLAAGLIRRPDPLRVGLLICFVTFAWPLESTDEFPTLYMLGWFYFALGLGLASAHIGRERSQPDSSNV